MAIKAVLFDLDGTLLDYDLRTDFLPNYFSALGKYFAKVIIPEKLVQGIMLGSDAIQHNDGSVTNEEAFAEVFYPFIDKKREGMEPDFMKFYQEVFPRLQRFAGYKSEARDVVEAAFSMGYRVVIATNPYFPAVAVQERLRWAGIHDLPFDIITSYENSHYAKPDPGYFREIVEKLGCRAEESLVVGDEAMDMVAGIIGCQTFLVQSPATNDDEITPQPTYQGNLYDVKTLLLSQLE
jgi:HAD superfamily hydrolase (TIGR01662 family)